MIYYAKSSRNLYSFLQWTGLITDSQCYLLKSLDRELDSLGIDKPDVYTVGENIVLRYSKGDIELELYPNYNNTFCICYNGNNCDTFSLKWSVLLLRSLFDKGDD